MGTLRLHCVSREITMIVKYINDWSDEIAIG